MNDSSLAASSETFVSVTTCPNEPSQEPADPASSKEAAEPASPKEPTDPASSKEPTDPASSKEPTDPASSKEPANSSKEPTDPASSKEPADSSKDAADPASPKDAADPASPKDAADPASPKDAADPASSKEPADAASPTEPTDPTTPHNPTSQLIKAIREDDINGAVLWARMSFEQKELNSVINNQTALHCALLQENVALVKLLLHRYDVDTRLTVDGWTPLMVATRCRDQSLLKILLEKDPTGIDLTNHSGFTALALAVDNGQLEATQHLLKSGASISCRTHGGVNLLGLAVRAGHVKITKMLIKGSGFTLDVSVTQDGFLPLSLAVANGKCAIVRYLTRFRPGCIHSARHKEWTMLGLAIKYNQLRMVKCLMRCRADARQLGAYGWSATMAAAALGRRDILHFLLNRIDLMQLGAQGETVVHVAAQYNHDGILEVILSRPNAQTAICIRDERGWTPLHVAVKEGHLRLVDQLLRFSPNLAQIKNFANQSPLVLAVELGNSAITECLLTHAGNSFDPSVFAHAVSLGDVNIVEQMIGHLQPMDPVAQSILISCQCQAAERGASELIRAIAKPDNVNKRHSASLSRRNALMYAAKENQIDMIHCLVEEFNAKLDLKSNEGFTAFAYSCRHGHFEAATLLYRLGSDIEGGSASAKSTRPLYLAACHHRYPIVTWLVAEGAEVDYLPRRWIHSCPNLSTALQHGLFGRSTMVGTQFMSDHSHLDCFLPRDCWKIVFVYAARDSRSLGS